MLAHNDSAASETGSSSIRAAGTPIVARTSAAAHQLADRDVRPVMAQACDGATRGASPAASEVQSHPEPVTCGSRRQSSVRQGWWQRRERRIEEVVMTTVHRDNVSGPRADGSTGTAAPTQGAVARYTAALLRLSLGWVFLWAFFDKTFGLGHETAGKDAWTNGGSPTKGFLAFAATGPFEGMYHQIAGQTWADWLFMLGLLCIGAGLLLGVAMRAT